MEHGGGVERGGFQSSTRASRGDFSSPSKGIPRTKQLKLVIVQIGGPLNAISFYFNFKHVVPSGVPISSPNDEGFVNARCFFSRLIDSVSCALPRVQPLATWAH